LIIDEALAVGDMGFQLKCIERLKSFQRSGRTLVLVTHHRYMIRNFCTRALWLDHGKSRGIGDVISMTDAYADFLDQPRGDGEDEAAVVGSQPIVNIERVLVHDEHSNKLEIMRFGEPFAITISYRLNQEYEGLVGAVAILSREKVNVCGLNTKRDGVPLPSKPGVYELTVEYPDVRLLPGTYHVRIAFLESAGVGFVAVRAHAASFTVKSTSYRAEGLCLLVHNWRVNHGPDYMTPGLRTRSGSSDQD
jgi:teichoic acid transport system ATP-binding protein